MTRRIVSDLEQEVYDRQRAARGEDRVLSITSLHPHALNARERAVADRLVRQSADAVRQVRAEMSDRHVALRGSLARLKEATR